MDVYIYTLTDPRTGEVRYVGKTCKRLSQRLSSHLYDAPRIPSHRSNWIIQLLALGLKPSISLIDTIEDSNDLDWQAREVYWIAHYRRIGVRLTNLDSGGRRGKCMSEESKIKCGIAARKRGPMTEFQRQRIIESNKARIYTPKMLEEMSKIRIGKKPSAETLANMSLAQTGRKHSVESKLKRSILLTGKKRTPEQIERNRKSQLGKKLTERHKQNISKGLNKHYENNDWNN